MNAMKAFVFILALVRANLYCEEKKMNCKQSCPSGWNHIGFSDHGCCASFWSCGGNKRTCQNPCHADVANCASYANSCTGCKQTCSQCFSGFMLENGGCVVEPIKQRQINQLNGQWIRLSGVHASGEVTITETVTTENSNTLGTEEWASTSLEVGASATLSYTKGGATAAATVSVAAGSETGRGFASSVTKTLGNAKEVSVTQVCEIDNFPWMDPGQVFHVYQYAYKSTTTDGETIWVKSSDFRCMPEHEVPLCPPSQCDDPVCQMCPSIIPEADSSIVTCQDYHPSCTANAANGMCTDGNAVNMDYMNDNCAESCGWCDGDDFTAHCPADGDTYGANGANYCQYWTSYCSWHSLVQEECAGTCCEFASAADGAVAMPPVPQEGMGAPSCLSDCDVDFMMEEPRCTFLMGCDSKDDCPCLSDCGEEEFALVMGAKGMCEKAADDMDMDAATFFSVDRPVGSNTNNILIGVTIASLAIAAIVVAVLCRFNRSLVKEAAHLENNISMHSSNYVVA